MLSLHSFWQRDNTITIRLADEALYQQINNAHIRTLHRVICYRNNDIKENATQYEAPIYRRVSDLQKISVLSESTDCSVLIFQVP